MGVQNPNSTSYVHPDEPNLLNLHKALEYNANGQPIVRVSIGNESVEISGNVFIPGNIEVFSTPDNPVHSHITEVGTSDVLTVPWLPVAGNVTVDNFPSNIRITDMPGITGNVGVSGNVSISQLPGITGNVGVSGNVDITRLPAITGNVDVTRLPGITGNVKVYGNVTVDNFPSNIRITDMPGITGNVHVYGNVSVDNFPSNVSITQMPGVTIVGNVEITNDIGNPIPISKNTTTNSSTNPIYVSNEGSTVTVGDLPAASLTAFDEPFAIGITPVIQADVMYGLDPDVWITTQLNNGNVTVTENTTWQVQSGTTAGGYARLATAAYMSYQPGQGSMFRWTAAFTTTDSASTDPYPTKNSLGIDNIVQNTGPIDREDGYSFGYSGSSANDASRKIGILHRRAGRAETRALTITTAPTGNQTATITLNGVAYTVAITATNGGGVNYTANQIALALKAQAEPDNLWDIEGCNGVVTFTYYSPGAKNGTYSFSSAGAGTLAVGTFSQIYAGATPTDIWTYVDDWDNQTIEFDPAKLNVFGVDLRWLGAGRVRFFMEDPATGKMVLVHTQRWSGQYLVPHVNKPSLRIVYRSGTTNLAITPSRNVVVTGASVMTAIQGAITQTRPSQGWYDVNTTTKAKDVVHHLISIQNPYVRNSSVNKSSIIVQSLTVAVQGSDPSVIYVVKNSIGTASLLVFENIPNSTTSMFCQYSHTETTANLAVERISNIQTVGPNGTAAFNLADYNLMLNPGETVNIFISSSSTLSRTSTGLTWKVD